MVSNRAGVSGEAGIMHNIYSVVPYYVGRTGLNNAKSIFSSTTFRNGRECRENLEGAGIELQHQPFFPNIRAAHQRSPP